MRYPAFHQGCIDFLPVAVIICHQSLMLDNIWSSHLNCSLLSSNDAMRSALFDLIQVDVVMCRSGYGTLHRRATHRSTCGAITPNLLSVWTSARCRKGCWPVPAGTNPSLFGTRTNGTDAAEAFGRMRLRGGCAGRSAWPDFLWISHQGPLPLVSTVITCMLWTTGMLWSDCYREAFSIQ